MTKILLLAAVLATFALSAKNVAKTIEVYESPTCGCCDEWADYMRKNGYEVKIHKTNDFMKIKDEKKIKPEYQSCHTGIIEGYAIEGHVPEDALAWILKNKPKDIIGVSTPGMPQGSPGMEQGLGEEEYPVILMLKNGGYKIFDYYKGHKRLHKTDLK